MGRDDGLLAFGRRLRELRDERGMSQRALAEAAHSSKSRVSAYETGQAWPTLDTVKLFDRELNADGELVRLFLDVPRASVEVDTLRAELSHGLDELWEIDQRRDRIRLSTVDEVRLLYAEDEVRRLIFDNERRAPLSLVPRARKLRWYVEEQLTQARMTPRQQERFYVVGVHLCGLLGAFALDLGFGRRAEAYGLEAFELADAIDMPDVRAWARAAQSLIAYYLGDYHSALAFARDGLRRAPNGRHAIRLTVNGEARALARLGDGYGVDAAVERAFAILADYPAYDAVSPSLSLDAYCLTRTAANAATAYLALEQRDKVNRYAKQAVKDFDRAGMRGPQALSRLDLATAALMGDDPEPDRAGVLAKEAMTVTTEERYESVNQRAREFVAAGQRWRDEPTMQEVAEMLTQRTPPALPSSDVL